MSLIVPAVWLISFLMTLRHVEPFYTNFYSISWWCYIVWLASRNELRKEGSLFCFPALFQKPIPYLGMVFFSATLWFFFELYNSRLHNWSYVGVPAERWIRWPGYFVSFGTVLPGIFETARWLHGWLPLGAWTTRGLGDTEKRHGSAVWNKSLATSAVVLGLLSMVLPLLYPAWCFPMIWVSLVLILDPMMEAVGETNLAANLLFGDRRRPVLLLCSGAICGFFWEFWNYWAGAKWIYTLPHFGSWKVFEMPLLGYLGFLPFAMECWVTYAWGRRYWDKSTLGGRTVMALVMCAICIWGVYLVDHFVVQSYR